MHPTHSGKTPGPANYTMHSSIGAQRLSQRPSSATYDFGTMERARAAKMYIGPIHARAYPAVSPGPAGTSRENSDNAYRDLERPVGAHLQQSAYTISLHIAEPSQTALGLYPWGSTPHCLHANFIAGERTELLWHRGASKSFGRRAGAWAWRLPYQRCHLWPTGPG